MVVKGGEVNCFLVQKVWHKVREKLQEQALREQYLQEPKRVHPYFWAVGGQNIKDLARNLSCLSLLSLFPRIALELFPV